MLGSTPRTLTIWHCSSTVEHPPEERGVEGPTPSGATKIMHLWPSGLGDRLQSGIHRFDSGWVLQISVYGGTVDTAGSNPVARKGVLVRI